jgi:hypothetical protein
MKTAFLVLLLLLAAIPLLAADPEFETGGYLNGRGWQTFDLSSRSLYLRGVVDGASWVTRFCSSKDFPSVIADSITMIGITWGEMAKAVDGFYSDSLNMRVPVIDVLEWVKMKHDGATPQALEEKAANLRAKFNIQHEPVKPTPPQ